MDFTQFDARAASEKPQPMDIMHPVTGEPIMDGDKPCRVLVIGTESRTAQDALGAIKRAKATDTKKGADDPTMAEIHASLVEAATPLIAGFENVSRGDAPATAADAGWFLNMQMINGKAGEKSFVEQVLAFSNGRANFLGKGPKG